MVDGLKALSHIYKLYVCGPLKDRLSFDYYIFNLFIKSVDEHHVLYTLMINNES